MPMLYSPDEHHAFINLFNYIVSQCRDNVFTRYQTTGLSFASLTYEQFDRITTNLACQWYLAFLKDVAPDSPIAFVADHSVEYAVSAVAVMKLRRVLLEIAPRNSNAAMHHLAVNAGAKCVVSCGKYLDKVRDSMESCADIVCHSFERFDIAAMAQEPLHPDADRLIDRQFGPEDKERTAIILHSSGTTSFPKLIHLSNRYVITLAQHDSYELALADGPPPYTVEPSDVFLVGFPMFHIGGLYQMFSPIMAGASTLLFSQLPILPHDLIAAIDTYNVTITGQTPIVLEQLYQHVQETGHTRPLEKLKMLHYGGAPLRKEIGDFFESFCKLQCRYGSTEMGISFRSSDAHGWWTLQPVRIVADYLCLEPVDKPQRLYHLTLRAGCPTLASHLTTRPDGTYATNDLVMEDPPGSGCWRTVGRMDDTLVMQNGEKTNPVPMEAAIRQSSSLIKQCVVIAEHRPCAAVLVELLPKEAAGCSPHEHILQVQAAVDQANRDAPKHSSILPQMIYILPLDCQLPATDKGTVMRGQAAELFASEIESMYSTFLNAHATIKRIRPGEWCLQQMESFLTHAAAQVLRMDESAFDNNRSLFDYGLDSILSIQLRNRIEEEFTVSVSFVYEHPSIASMAATLLTQHTMNFKKAKTAADEDSYDQAQQLLDHYLARADKDFNRITELPGKNHRNHGKETVLLTGATGALGAYLLRDLLLSPQVVKVYCPVKVGHKNSTNDTGALMARIRRVFAERHLDTTLLDAGGNKVQVLPMKQNAADFGWGKETYGRLQQEVTIVQMCGWLVDFNQPVGHFDHTCLQGLYNLLQFAYRRTDPIHVHVISSVSATAGIHAPRHVRESVLSPADPRTAMPIGYAQSKYIVEHLFEFLWLDKGWPCMIERMGQVCGDTQHAMWNPSEMYPLIMVGGGAILRKMPDLDNRTIDWLPIDYAAASIVEIMLEKTTSVAAGQHVFNIVNPSVMTWPDLLDIMRTCGMQFDIVSPEAWVQALSEDQNNPAYRLLSFMQRTMISQSAQAKTTTTIHDGPDQQSTSKTSFREEKTRTMRIWETKHTAKVSPSLAQTPTFNVEFFAKHLAYWKHIGFCKS